MSLFAALTVAVGGLAAQSDSIGNISDNLANAQTTGFKSIDTDFESLVTQSNANVNDPGGVRATPQYNNDVQGNVVSAQSSTDLAISGAGFFPVRPAVVDATGTTTFGGTTYYTRAGDFALNKDGFLVNSEGYYLTGYNVSTSGVVDTSQANPIQLEQLLDNPVATNSVSYAANLPASVTSMTASPFVSSPSTIEVYDSLGAEHAMTLTWTKTPSDLNNAAASTTIGNDLTLTSKYTGATGPMGNDISLAISADTNLDGNYTATIKVNGQAMETYTDIPAATFWTTLAGQINGTTTSTQGASRLVEADALSGASTDALDTSTDLTTYSLTGGTGSGDSAYFSTGAGGLNFTALSPGSAGDDITVQLAQTDAQNHPTYMDVVIKDSKTGATETIPSSGHIDASDADFWTEVRDAVNTNSTLVEATYTNTDGSITASPGSGAAFAATSLANGADPIPTANLWSLQVSVPGGNGVDPYTKEPIDYTATIPVTFNSTTSGTTAAGTLESITAYDGTNDSYSSTTTGAAQITLPLDFAGSGAVGTQNIVLNLGDFNSSSNGVTQFADTTVSVSTFSQNGIPRGSFQSLSIDQNGYVALNYDNGQIRTIAQIPIVQFFAQDQLQRVTGGAYEQTLTSGDARYSAPGTNGAGTIVGSSLESSNVDIADEFTKLIQAQQIYSANAKTITTADNMMQEAIDIIR
jgi:flagellar hook protein FlgE